MEVQSTYNNEAIIHPLASEKKFTYLQKIFFNYLFNKKIVYNTCMEDPRVDAKLLGIDANSEICTLTSAGCNTFHYLFEGAKTISCVDANICQAALMDLKCATFKAGTYNDLWYLFGVGIHPKVEQLYRESLRKELRPDSASYWDKNIHFFKDVKRNKGFQFHTGCGFISRCFSFLNDKNKKNIEKLFELDDKQLQIQAFEKYLEPYLRSWISRWMIYFSVKTGVPSRQLRMISKDPKDVYEFLVSRIKKSLTILPAKDNYFFYLYIFGKYTEECCPQYLKRESFDFIRKKLLRIEHEHSYLKEFLLKQKKCYSHFCLLDHLDWLTWDTDLLKNQWRAILSRSKKGTKIVVRSFFSKNDWLPSFVMNHIKFIENIKDIVATDRIEIYNNTKLIEVTNPLLPDCNHFC